MPKPLAQKVLLKGMFTVRPRQGLELAFAVRWVRDGQRDRKALRLVEVARGCVGSMITSPSIDILACMIFFFHSGGVGMESGALSCVSIIRPLPKHLSHRT